MSVHHTKSKGDLGVAKAHADLVAKGYSVMFPASEHLPFDLVAYDDGRFVRVQVKLRSAVAGSVSVHLRSVWADRRGTQVRPMDKSSVDVVCIYCPDSDSCYYVDPRRHASSVTLRLTPAKNHQVSRVLLADDFRGLPESLGPCAG